MFGGFRSGPDASTGARRSGWAFVTNGSFGFGRSFPYGVTEVTSRSGRHRRFHERVRAQMDDRAEGPTWMISSSLMHPTSSPFLLQIPRRSQRRSRWHQFTKKSSHMELSGS